MSHLINHTRIILCLLYFAIFYVRLLLHFILMMGQNPETFKKYDPDLRVIFNFPMKLRFKHVTDVPCEINLYDPSLLPILQCTLQCIRHVQKCITGTQTIPISKLGSWKHITAFHKSSEANRHQVLKYLG